MKQHNFYRPTWVEVDLAAVRHNYLALRKKLPSGTKMMVAVKANAYGHGLVPVAEKLVACGADYLGVACMDEALILRQSGIKTPILNLGAFLKGDATAMVAHDISATVADVASAKLLDAAAHRLKKMARVHIKVDTGMGRIGCWYEEADEMVFKLCSLANLDIEGLFTHFPVADTDEAFTRSQIAMFCALVDKLQIKGIQIPLKHTANSMAVVGFKGAHFNLVRPGLAVYGMHPKEDFSEAIDLKPVLSFRTRIVYLKDVAKGRSISYGRTHITTKKTKIATLPVGYGDGYNRLLSNKGQVLIRGKLCPVVGVVCMDQTMIDVGHLKEVALEDEVILIGSQGNKIIRAEDIARQCNTIPYEVICWISPRVPRVYRNK
jgi:alanine racemase